MYRLHFFRKSSHSALLRFSRIWRVISLSIAAVFASVSMYEGTVVWPAVILGTLSLIAAIYTETWVFDISEAQQVTRRIGLWPLMITKRFPASDILSVSLRASKPQLVRTSDQTPGGSSYRPTRGDRRLIRLLIIRQDAPPVTLYSDLSRDMSKIMETGKLIASFLQVPFTEELE